MGNIGAGRKSGPKAGGSPVGGPVSEAMTKPGDILSWWIDEVGPKGWYGGGEELDAEIRKRWGATYEELLTGAYGLWLTGAGGTLAYLLLTDQFTRNMFRGSARAFEADSLARAVTKAAIRKDWDLRMPGMERQFFYTPLMHSENLVDQDRAVRLVADRMPDGGKANLIHAQAHRAIIRKFGRFPFRNEALGRATTEAERAWMEEGGYGLEMRLLKQHGGARDGQN